MYLNLNVGSLGVSGRQSELIELALTYGFKGMDLDVALLARQADLHGFEHASRFLSSANLRIGGFDLPVRWQGADPDFLDDLEQLSKIAEIANRLGATGCRTVVMPASNERPYHENFEFHRHRFTKIAEVLARHSICLGLDFLATPCHRVDFQHQFIHSPDALVTLAKTVGMDNVGIAVDVWQWHVAGANWDPLRELTADEIVSVRVADVPADADVAAITDEQRLLPAPDGTIDVASIVQQLKHIEYRGPITPFPHASQFTGVTRDALVRQAGASIELHPKPAVEDPEAGVLVATAEGVEETA
jgi:sugar phosphate isomerase/epimerase